MKPRSLVSSASFALFGLGLAFGASRALADADPPRPLSPPRSSLPAPTNPARSSSSPAPNSPTPGQPLPAPGAAPRPFPSQIAPPDSEPEPSGQSPGLPGLGDMMRPDGIALPGGLGFIRRAPDHIGIQLNTPDGPIEFNVPRLQRPVIDPNNIEAPPQPGDETAAPLQAPRQGARDRGGRAARDFNSATRHFLAKNYPLTLRRLTRALERDPGDRDLLQLRSLVYFALGDYPAAYHDAVTVLATDDVWAWPALRACYQSADEYTAQYRALEAQALANLRSVETWFLLAYHNLMLGNHEAARRQFDQVAAIDGGNEIARRLAKSERPPQPLVPVPTINRGNTTTNRATPSKPDAAQSPVRPPVSRGKFAIDLGQPLPTAPKADAKKPSAQPSSP